MILQTTDKFCGVEALIKAWYLFFSVITTQQFCTFAIVDNITNITTNFLLDFILSGLS